MALIFLNTYKRLTMKKLLSLLVVLSLFTGLRAQTSRDEARRVILGGENTRTDRNGKVVYDRNGYPTNYPNSSQQAEVDRVNREYDAKINSIRNNRNLSTAEKDRIIRQLEQERRQKINAINNRYGGTYGRNGRNDRNDRYDDDYNKKNKRYKKDNGKHLGWEIGKGNPHRTGNAGYQKGGKGKGKGKGKH